MAACTNNHRTWRLPRTPFQTTEKMLVGSFTARWVSSYSEVRFNCPPSDLYADNFQEPSGVAFALRTLWGGGSRRARRFSRVINLTLTCYLIFTNSLQAIWIDTPNAVSHVLGYPRLPQQQAGGAWDLPETCDLLEWQLRARRRGTEYLKSPPFFGHWNTLHYWSLLNWVVLFCLFVLFAMSS